MLQPLAALMDRKRIVSGHTNGIAVYGWRHNCHQLRGR